MYFSYMLILTQFDPDPSSLESAQWFRMGYYGVEFANRSTLETIKEDAATFSCVGSAVLYMIFENETNFQAHHADEQLLSLEI